VLHHIATRGIQCTLLSELYRHILVLLDFNPVSGKWRGIRGRKLRGADSDDAVPDERPPSTFYRNTLEDQELVVSSRKELGLGFGDRSCIWNLFS
jgi:hypothetical protein